MAAFVECPGFKQDLARKLHNLNSDSFKIALASAAPTGTAFVAGSTDLTTGGGYTQGGQSCGVGSATESAGTLTFSVPTTPVTWTASSGGFTCRYALIYNSTANLVVGYWDYGSSVTLSGANGDQFVWTEGGSILTY